MFIFVFRRLMNIVIFCFLLMVECFFWILVKLERIKSVWYIKFGDVFCISCNKMGIMLVFRSLFLLICVNDRWYNVMVVLCCVLGGFECMILMRGGMVLSILMVILFLLFKVRLKSVLVVCFFIVLDCLLSKLMRLGIMDVLVILILFLVVSDKFIIVVMVLICILIYCDCSKGSNVVNSLGVYNVSL